MAARTKATAAATTIAQRSSCDRTARALASMALTHGAAWQEDGEINIEIADDEKGDGYSSDGKGPERYALQSAFKLLSCAIGSGIAHISTWIASLGHCEPDS